MKVTLCQLGARLHYAAAESLYEHGMLSCLYTDVYSTAALRRLLRVPAISKFGGEAAGRLLQRHSCSLPDRIVRHFPLFGLEYALRLQNTATRADVARTCLWANQTFERKILNVGFEACDSVYAFNTAAAGLFRVAKSRGLHCILEQTIAPLAIEETLVADEFRRCDMVWEVNKFTNRLVDREREEWALADVILAGSPFVARSLESLGVALSKIAVVPYGVAGPPAKGPLVGKPSPFDGRRPLRIVMIGNDMIRKGVTYLVEAVRSLGRERARATLVGRCTAELRTRCGEAENVDYAGSIPGAEIFSLLRAADIFVLPSVCEGSATAIYEALACGIPVVCTENSGSVVTDGAEGFIVPIRDAGAIRDALEKIIYDPARLAVMREKALTTAAMHTVESYGQRLISVLGQVKGSE